MVLEPKERATFFSNWLGLFAFVNDKHKLVKGFGHPKKPVGIKAETLMKLRTKLWKNTRIIDEYIDSVWDLSRDDIQILKGWKKKKKGTFILMRHLKKYSVFLDEGDSLYGVIGISVPISGMIPGTVFNWAPT